MKKLINRLFGKKETPPVEVEAVYVPIRKETVGYCSFSIVLNNGKSTMRSLPVNLHIDKETDEIVDIACKGHGKELHYDIDHYKKTRELKVK